MCGDVSGKGMPAALFMAKAVAEFKFNSAGRDNPSEVLHHLNEGLSEEDSAGLFVTMNYLIFNLGHRVLTLSNAGHMPVLRVRKDGTADELDAEGGMPIGLMTGIEFGLTTVDAAEGDVYVLYTDGISEARNRRKEDYEIERLKAAVLRSRSKSAEAIKDEVLKDVRDFVGHAPQHDDMTLLVLKVNATA
ncbi:MAG: serine/threonine-protein phosphatase [Candidatus Omnitrophica bacterium]|nr:serine/threonine-protein phosphatase [Candidatus Omnitrophota bacterium]